MYHWFDYPSVIILKLTMVFFVYKPDICDETTQLLYNMLQLTNKLGNPVCTRYNKAIDSLSSPILGLSKY